VIVIAPGTAAAGTVKLTVVVLPAACVHVLTVAPPIVMPSIPLMFVPVTTTTVVPGTPVVGVKLVIVGAANVNVVAFDVPPGVVTVTPPVFAPAGTITVIDVSELTVTDVAAVPLKLTVAPATKFVPVIVIELPTIADEGVRAEVVGVS